MAFYFCPFLKKVVNYIKKSKLFPCYSIPLRDFLTSKGIRYELVGVHPKTNKMFWVYIKDNKLNELTSEWSRK